MPPLLLCPPRILDHTFPRDEHDLREVATALGNLAEMVQSEEAHLFMGSALRRIVESFDWSSIGTRGALFVEIHRFLSMLFLSQHRALVFMDLEGVVDYAPHPIPEDCQDAGRVAEWSDESGRLLKVHQDCLRTAAFCIGVTSTSAFAGKPKLGYAGPPSGSQYTA